MIDFTIPERFAIVGILFRIMEADQIVNTREVEFMDKMLAEFKITESDIDIIDTYEYEQCCTIVRSMDADKKQTAMKIFVEMAKCDGHIDPRELKTIEDLWK
jgi:uncharacterized tellurite resistance protein B-like protein